MFQILNFAMKDSSMLHNKTEKNQSYCRREYIYSYALLNSDTNQRSHALKSISFYSLEC